MPKSNIYLYFLLLFSASLRGKTLGRAIYTIFFFFSNSFLNPAQFRFCPSIFSHQQLPFLTP